MKFRLFAAAVFIAASTACHAEVKVEGAWVRPSVQGQTTSAAYMTLTCDADTSLVAVRSPATGSAQLHEMKMDGSVMRMRAMDAIDLRAGKPVTLAPGGMHIMLLDLKAPLMANASVPITLIFRDGKGQESAKEITAPVLPMKPGSMQGRMR